VFVIFTRILLVFRWTFLKNNHINATTKRRDNSKGYYLGDWARFGTLIRFSWCGSAFDTFAFSREHLGYREVEGDRGEDEENPRKNGKGANWLNRRGF
jgi:hypothetical protein